MIVVVAGQKGGSGKTTIAVNLVYEAMQKGKTLLVDSDPQGTSAKWIEWRKEQDLPVPKLYQLTGDLYDPLLDQNENYEYVIVDTGGVDSAEMRSALLSADILITPIRPGQFDIETLDKMNDIVIKTKAQGNHDLQARVILTHTPTSPLMADEKEAKKILNELSEFTPIKTSLKYRSVYWRSTSAGLSISEADDPKAKGEIQNFCNEVLGL
jgi:chromosome partitioning protein